MKRLPRKIRFGHYVVDIVLCSQSVLRDEMDDDDGGVYNACWVPDLDLGNTIHGRIFVLDKLSLGQKWDALWHELYHALTDISGWDSELRQGDT